MILTRLTIELQTYGSDKGKHTGSAVFSGEAGTVSLKLNQDHIDEIFRTCAGSIIETSKAAARHLTMSVIQHAETKAISGKGGAA